MRANAKFPVTSPPVSIFCLHAINSLLEKDKKQRIGAADFTTSSNHPFFRPIDFEALERKELEPIFTPSSDKSNFDATYDIKEQMLKYRWRHARGGRSQEST